jgi:cobyrinic acid a,c-diamide synthase
VVLVVDASAMSTSVAALVHGYATYQAGLEVAGVILNRVGSDGHEILLREALAPLGIPVLGALRRDVALEWRDRHLGLVPVAEAPASAALSLDRLAAAVADRVDLAAVAALARSAASLPAGHVPLPAPGPEVEVAVAGGAAFSFTYTDTLDALAAGGATVTRFDPLTEPVPPSAGGLMLGGGFPEVFCEQLASNRRLLEDLGTRVRAGLPTWAECGGLLLLAQELDGRPMAGAVPARAAMTGRLTLGYREVRTLADSVVGPAGATFRGHEFHYSAVDPPGSALELSSRWGVAREGWASPTLLATYVHHHPGGDPSLVEGFLRRCAGVRLPAS